MSNCYRCEVELSKLNYSVEHIIINACGGRLKSTKLLCKKCNMELGERFDKELALSTNEIANLLDIKRERGSPQKFKAVSKDGKEYYLNNKLIASEIKPTIKLINFDSKNIEDKIVQISAPNKKLFNQVIKGLKRKYPNLLTENAYEKAEIVSPDPKRSLSFNMTIGGKGTFKSILKTAVSFYMLNAGDRNEIKHLLHYLNADAEGDFVWLHYPNKSIYEPLKNEVSHVLKVVGSAKEKILYAYIELFNSHCFIVKLNINYNGIDIDHDYIFDVRTLKILNSKTELSLNRKQLINLFKNKDAKPFENVQKRLDRLLKIYSRTKIVDANKNKFRKIIDDTFNEIFVGVEPEERIDESVLKRMKENLYLQFEEKYLRVN